MRIVIGISLLFLGLIITSCQSSFIKYTPLISGNKIFSPTDINDIKIYITKKPNYEYEELGIISVTSSYLYNNELEAYEKMKLKASEIGATALIIMQTLTDVETYSTISFDFYGNPINSDKNKANYIYQAMAIRNLNE